MKNLKFNIFYLTSIFLICLSGCVKFLPEKYLKEATVKSGEYFYEFSFTDKQPNVKNDLEYHYFENQQINSSEGYVGKKPLDGDFRGFYYDNQQIYQFGEFHKGLKDGNWKYYKKNGGLMRIEDWKKGELKDVDDMKVDRDELIAEDEALDSSKTKFPALKNIFKGWFKSDSTVSK